MIDHNIIGYAEMFKKEDLQTFADKNHILDPVNWKSICRYIFIISDGAVYFSSTKYRFIAGSTPKVEYIAFSLASQ